MIPVKVEQLFISNMGFVVLLRGETDPRVLQIFIGAAEAQAIAIHLNGVEIPRPLTHDLMKNMLDEFGIRLSRIEVNDLKDGTFYARLVLETGDREDEFVIDSRPSDAIALALRVGAKVFVDEKVMDEAGRLMDKQEIPPPPEGTPTEKKDPKAPSKPVSPIEKHKKDLEKAVEDERYEDAAIIRDELKKLESSQ